MRKHPQIGRHILRSVPFLRDVAEVVYSHHEKYDGSGYPRGLRAEAIPFAARVFAVADVFDALTSDRSYHQAMPVTVACAAILAGSGGHFDPEVVEAFRRIPADQWPTLARAAESARESTSS